MSELLIYDPSKRPTAAKVLQHAYFQQVEVPRPIEDPKSARKVEGNKTPKEETGNITQRSMIINCDVRNHSRFKCRVEETGHLQQLTENFGKGSREHFTGSSGRQEAGSHECQEVLSAIDDDNASSAKGPNKPNYFAHIGTQQQPNSNPLWQKNGYGSKLF